MQLRLGVSIGGKEIVSSVTPAEGMYHSLSYAVDLYLHLLFHCFNEGKKDPPIPWAKSQAKKDLLKVLVESKNQQEPFWTMTLAEVWASKAEFQEYKKTNFCNNLRSLRKAVLKNVRSIAFDDAAAKQHLTNFPPSEINNRGNLRMHGHPAKQLLELDVAAGRANGRKPSELKKDRPEYAGFGTKQFCKAVHNEKQKQRGEKVWTEKRNKEGAKRHAKRREAQLLAAGMAPSRDI